MAERCLSLDEYRFAAIDSILKLPEAPASLVGKALDRAASWPWTVETLALRREMPEENLRAALRHSNWKVALAAAVGEWCAGPKADVRTEFLLDWREAILRARAKDEGAGLEHWLNLILTRDSDLALDWLRVRLRDPDIPDFFWRGPFASAAQALQVEQRVKLLAEVPAVPILCYLLPSLVNRNPELYRHVLARAELRDYHLAPLGGKPDEAWSELALLALDAGHSAEHIACATIWAPGRHSYAGPGPHWEEWAKEFASLEDHSQGGIREIGHHGRKIAEHFLEKARLEQEQIGLHGL